MISIKILTFEEFNNKFSIDNKAMSNIKIEDIGKDKNLMIIESNIERSNSIYY